METEENRKYKFVESSMSTVGWCIFIVTPEFVYTNSRVVRPEVINYSLYSFNMI